MKLLKKEFVFTGTPSVPSCHASTIVKAANGTLVCAWFAGTHERNCDVGIWYTVRKRDTWSSPQRIPAAQQIAHWNPVLFEQKDGTVCLYYKIGENIADWKTMLVTFDASFVPGTPRELIAGDTSGGRGPVKNKPIYTSSGTLLAPASTEKGAWLPFIDMYGNDGAWHKICIPTDGGIGLIQPTLWESERGCIHAMMRSNQGKIYRSDSTDGGQSWCHAYPIDMPNNNSGLDCVMLADGRLVLVCNPVEKNWGKRSPLSIFVSRDNGATFTQEMELETADGEFSYPAIIACGNTLYVTYTWERTAIACCEIQM